MPTVSEAHLSQLSAEDRARIEARYPRRSQRTLGIVLAALLVLTLGPWTLWAGFTRSNPGIHGQVHSFRVISGSEVLVRLDVHRPDPSTSGLCTLQAQAESGGVVGELTVAFSPSGQQDVTKEVSVKTSERATTAIVVDCHRV